MKKLQPVIMMHPSREKYLPYLKEKLGADTPVAMDEKNNLWDTCRRAWLAGLESGAEYVVVIQDDAIICDDFHEMAEKWLTGDFFYSFYAGQMLAKRIDVAAERGKDHIMTGAIMNEIALCLHRDRIADMVKYLDDREAKDDHMMQQWAHVRRLPIFYTIPSLVDHRDEHSIYRENYNKPQFHRPRRAHNFYAKQ